MTRSRGALSGGALRWLTPQWAVDAALATRRHAPSALIDPLEERAGLRAGESSWPTRSPGEPVALIGPVNYAGQAGLWARAVTASGIPTLSMGIVNSYDFPVDLRVPRAAYLSSSWARAQERFVLDHVSHVVFEAGRPVLGLRYGSTVRGDARVLRRAGLQVAHVCHGTDVRSPRRHAQSTPFSPYAADPSQWRAYEAMAAQHRRAIERAGGPVFVSTPDLLADLPRAQWCPIVVDPERWVTTKPPLTEGVPLVVHAPTSGPLKGSAIIDATLGALQDAGRVRYVRAQGLRHEDMRALIREADIVIDQMALGIYSVTALEAMAAGRVTLAAVEPIRDFVRQVSGLEIPMPQVDPVTLPTVLDRILEDRAWAQGLAARGPSYVRALHDGRYSAQVLGTFLA